jgi:hypothetical protein
MRSKGKGTILSARLDDLAVADTKGCASRFATTYGGPDRYGEGINMIAALLTPMMIASSPLMITPPPANTYSHETQTTNNYKLAQTSTQTTASYGTTMPTVGTNTCNQADGCPNGHDSDTVGSDSVVSDFN